MRNKRCGLPPRADRQRMDTNVRVFVVVAIYPCVMRPQSKRCTMVSCLPYIVPHRDNLLRFKRVSGYTGDTTSVLQMMTIHKYYQHILVWSTVSNTYANSSLQHQKDRDNNDQSSRNCEERPASSSVYSLLSLIANWGLRLTVYWNRTFVFANNLSLRLGKWRLVSLGETEECPRSI